MRAVTAALVALCVLPVANASATVVTSSRYFTCLVRSSDGFNGCWLDGTVAGDSLNSAREWQKADGCNGINVIYMGNTPAYRGSTPRANSIGLVLGGDAGNWLPWPVTWFGLGGGTSQYYGSQTDRQPGSIITAMIALDAQDRYARVQIYLTGASWCRWKRA